MEKTLENSVSGTVKDGNSLKNPEMEKLVKFADQYGPACESLLSAEVEPLSGDAGFRRYFRLSSSPSLMLVDTPPDKERNIEFVRINHFLSRDGVRVPKMHAVNFDKGIFVLEDLGSMSLQDRLSASRSPDEISSIYGRAADMLFSMQRIESRPVWLEHYSAELLGAEMQLFTEWFVKELLGLSLTSSQQCMIDRVFQTLIRSATEQPQCFVHRDYHCRNLMVLDADENLAAIDFQDAVWGPITYDMVSLGRDCYVRWDEATVDQFVQMYASRLASSGLITSEQKSALPRWFDLMGLQRHIKVLGIFARLFLRDNKPGYLNDLPLVLRYTLDVLGKHSEFADFYEWMLSEIVPVAERQHWYRDWQTAGDSIEFDFIDSK